MDSSKVIFKQIIKAEEISKFVHDYSSNGE